jgi:heavy metal sensor kinase
MIDFRPKRLRTKLSLGFALVLAVVLLLYIGGTSTILYLQLRAQLHRHAIADVETLKDLLVFGADGKLQLHEALSDPAPKLLRQRLLEVLTPAGTVLLRNSLLGNRSLGGKPFPGEGEGGFSPRSILLSDGTPVFLVSRRHIVQGNPIIVRVGYSEEEMSRTIEEVLGAQLSCLLLVLLIAGLMGYGSVRHALEPLEQMALRAQQITPQRLHERLPVGGAREIGDLARTFNSTFDRLEHAFDQLRRFTSDASHELRTPLAAIRSVGEVGLHKDGTREDYREIIGSMLEEVNGLTRLIDDLLMIARADAGHLRLNRSVFPVFDLVREVIALIEVLAEEKAQKFILEGDEMATVDGDRLVLRQAFLNVLHNAVKYSPVGGVIDVHLHINGRYVLVEVADRGTGIPPEHWTKVFDRFYRVDKGRSREIGGAGLGLSIAKWAVQTHGGDIGVKNNPGGGCIFQIRLLLCGGIGDPAAARLEQPQMSSVLTPPEQVRE